MKKLMIGAVCAMMAAAATFAEPKVEITKAYQAEPGSGKVSYTYTISGLKTVTDLYIKVGAEGCSTTKTLTFTNVKDGTVTAEVDVKALLGQAYPNVTLVAELEDGVQLWENGPYFAKANIGATKPEESGYFFWWGGTTGYKRNSSNNGWVSAKDGSTFKFSSENSPTMQKEAATLKSTGWTDYNSGNLETIHDAATAKLGGPWRMMTLDELQKLVSTEYCQHEYVTEYKGKSVDGFVVKGKKGSAYENNEVFFPLTGRGAGDNLQYITTGYYWSSTPRPEAGVINMSYCLYLKSDSFQQYDYNDRYIGYPVRPVR